MAADDDDAAAAAPRRASRCIVFAVASGACAAINGAFAKLTTAGLTSSLARALAALLGLSSASANNAVDRAVRALFFGLNLAFNAVMWTLFTAALAAATSTTQVSIMNTSTNFVLTALLGLAIFSEALPPLWWVGAALLVVGNVIIGAKVEPAGDRPDHLPPDDSNHRRRRDRAAASDESDAAAAAAAAAEWKPLLQGTASGETYAGSVDEDAPHLGRLSPPPAA